MRMPPLPADSIHARACKLKCEKILTRPSLQTKVRKNLDTTLTRPYHPGAAGYFPVNSRNSPQFEGSFELYIFTRGDLAFTELISLGNYDTCTPIHITHKTVANKTGNNFYVYVRFSVNL